MRQALKQNVNKATTARTKSLSSPVGGWNARDSLAQMPPNDAVVLDNLFPEASFVRLRGGSDQFADTQTASVVESLMAYTGPTGQKLFAASNDKIFNVGAGGTIGSADLTGLANNRWQHINFGNVAGNWMAMVNGADTPQIYDGTNWADMSLSGSGLTITNLINVMSHENRLWFVEKDKPWVWYLDVTAISGTLHKFDLTGFLGEGGSIEAIATWSRDSGSGPNDYIVFISTEGELLLYYGTDPANASTWSLASIYRMGKPIGRRCFIRIGSELVLMTQNGFVPLSKLVNFGRQTTGIAISDKIKDAVSDAVSGYINNYGWEAKAFSPANFGIFNIPVAEGNTQYQFVVNTQTGAWCRFKGLNGNCWEVFGQNLYFGANDGTIWQAEIGTADGTSAIQTEALPAYSYFGAPGNQKRWTLARAVMRSTGLLTIAAKISVDFQYMPPSYISSASEAAGSAWDVSPWDTSPWGDSFLVTKKWKATTGKGNAAALGIKTSTKFQNIEWLSNDYIYEVGGPM